MKENPAAKEGLIQKLQALQNMTMANGCTESEALVAAGKAADLLERYGLSMEELKAASPNQLCPQPAIGLAMRTAASAEYLTLRLTQLWSRHRPCAAPRPS